MMLYRNFTSGDVTDENRMGEKMTFEIKIPQSQIKNAVRDIVAQKISPDAAKQSFEKHVQKEQQRITEHVNGILEQIKVPTQTNNWIQSSFLFWSQDEL